MIRGIFYFSGYVQGVGFRYQAYSIAQRYSVTGYVKNLADGKVELVVEGERDVIASFVGEVRKGMSGYVREVVEKWAEATNEFGRFEVRF